MKSLQIKPPFGKTILLALVWLFLFIGSLEVVARIPAVQERLPSQGFGSAHRQYEIQVDRLIKRENTEGQIDCVIVGNSHAARGIDPEIIEQALLEKTGEKFVCQNVGLNGVDVRVAQKMASVLAQEYHPRFIIFAVSFIDFDANLGGKGSGSIESSPWFKYQLGKTSLDGMVINSLYAYRYYLGLDGVIFRGKAAQVDEDGVPFENTQPNGYFPSAASLNIDTIKEATPEKLVEDYWYLAQIQDVIIESNEVNNFKILLSNDTPVLVIETPFFPKLFNISETGKLRHDEFLSMAAQLTEQYHRPFIPSQGIVNIPESGWLDFKHMNATGADVFSHWLADQITGSNETMQQLGILP